MNPDDSNLVEPQDGCPLCGERRADCLEWDEDNTKVTCSMCGTTYTPSTGTE
jgi:ribosomal protein S27E